MRLAAGYCECGCGQKTKLIDKIDNKRGMIRGEPSRFIKGHSGGYNRDKSLSERFWEKVNKSQDCWVWTGCKQSQGYGQIRVKRKALLTHRLSWELANGRLPADIMVLHKCDNPACVRPDHLFLGSMQDNVNDMMAKGRNGNGVQYGEDHHAAKLTVERVKLIRSMNNPDIQKLSIQFNVTPQTIYAVVNRKTWRGIE